jgi:hypothetical protein
MMLALVPRRVAELAMRSRNTTRGHRTWPYLALLAVVVAAMLWMAGSLAARSGLFTWSSEPSTQQVQIFMTFIGGGLATAATVFGALLTRGHNARERWRLQLETVLKSLESLPKESSARAAAVLSTLVLLGQERVAIRMLGPAWQAGDVDHGTATWLIGQVLTGQRTPGARMDGDRPDESAVTEAALLLRHHAEELTEAERGLFYFPGHFQRRWSTERDLPWAAKDSLLLTMGAMLASRDRSWWCSGGSLSAWPATILLECAEHESQEIPRASAAVLFAALHDCFADEIREHVAAERLSRILDHAAERARNRSVPPEYLVLAQRIRSKLGNGLVPDGA